LKNRVPCYSLVQTLTVGCIVLTPYTASQTDRQTNSGIMPIADPTECSMISY